MDRNRMQHKANIIIYMGNILNYEILDHFIILRYTFYIKTSKCKIGQNSYDYDAVYNALFIQIYIYASEQNMW